MRITLKVREKKIKNILLIVLVGKRTNTFSLKESVTLKLSLISSRAIGQCLWEMKSTAIETRTIQFTA